MTLMNATSLNDQVDYSGTNSRSFAEQTLNSIFNVSPRNTVIDDDDEDDDQDATLPDPDDDDMMDDEDTFPDADELDKIDDDDDLDDDDDNSDADSYNANADELDKIDESDNTGVINRQTNNDDDKGSVSTPFTKPSSFADRSDGRTTGRMIDHEPGSPNNL